MEFRAKLLLLLMIASFFNAIILEPDQSFAGVDYFCVPLLNRATEPISDKDKKKTLFDKAADAAKFLPQTVRLARVPVVGRYKTFVDKAEDTYDDLAERGKAAQDEWKADFVKRVDDKLPTKPEESLVYLRLVTSPAYGQKIWEMFVGADMVVARKRLGINPFGLIAKFRKGTNPELTEKEREYLSDVVVSNRRLTNFYGAFVNKVSWPDRIADLDYHLLSLVRAAHEVADTKGSPIKGIIEFEQEFIGAKVNIETYSGQIFLNSDRMAQEQLKYLSTTAFSEATTSLMLEVEKSKLKRYEDEINFIQFANDPERIEKAITGSITPDEQKAFEDGGEQALLAQMRKDRGKRKGLRSFKEYTRALAEQKAFEEGGELGLLAQMRKDRGRAAAMESFRKYVWASTVFRALLLGLAFMWVGNTILQHYKHKGQKLNPLDPNTPEPSPTEKDNQDQILEIFGQGNFNPFELKGLFDDRPDSKNPSAPASPCDPDHAIRDQYAKKGFANPHDVQLQDMDFLIWTNQQLITYGSTPDSACAQRFIQAWEASY